MSEDTYNSSDSESDSEYNNDDTEEEPSISQSRANFVPVIPLIQRPILIRKTKPLFLPKLTSSIYKYSTWHDVEYIQTMGDELNAPRVRKGPREKDQKKFRRLNNCNDIHHGKKGLEKRNYQHKQTNWEETQNCNLSYQELAERYQKKLFDQVLSRLKNVEHLEVIDNDIEDMSHLTFKECTYFVASRNYIRSFKYLPSLPKVKSINLEYNAISSYVGLNRLTSKTRNLRHLNMYGCPVTFTLNYRQKIFAALPDLITLDGLAKQDEDKHYFPEKSDSQDHSLEGVSSCVIL